MKNVKQIRNFAIIAHIDHGKSTLADRIMELTDTISEREQSDQLLDDLQVEQAHGVTVKSRTVTNEYQAGDGQKYELNFIDTPGHVDFAYEVSRSMSACEGAILLVDATKGVQAQTVANFRLAKAAGLAIIPVINKVDSQSAEVDRVESQIHNLDELLKDEKILKISAKTGLGVPEVLEAIVDKISAPTADDGDELKALVFDSNYDQYKGIVALVRVVSGNLTKQRQLRLMANQTDFNAGEVGILTPDKNPQDSLIAGEVGYIITGIKDPQKVRIGDTITYAEAPAKVTLPGYESSEPVVFAGLYPDESSYADLKLAVEKVALNDPAFHYREEVSDALGPGFRCGFLGGFHLQIIRERLVDEYGVSVLTTSPNVTYHVTTSDGQALTVENPGQFPDFSEVQYVEEPFVRATISTPNELLSEVMKLAEQYKGELDDLQDNNGLIDAIYNMPLSEIAFEFFNKLKSVSHGYATLSSKMIGYRVADMVQVDVRINYADVDSLAFVTHRLDAPKQTQELVHKLKYTIPRKLYPMPVQAMVEGKAIARVDVPPLRKNAAVSGDKKSVSKKQALLRRQNINKRKAAQNDIKLPQSVFNAILEVHDV
ncbi:elongation factor 4 [Lentilactobacillus curieae]|uniref:Elongation factor 4 n=1 Tax=Lentilactobacillus curieae TaxID=1138822 RepID=A0A1S6QH32_9LACO|nr:translation elongation factor 4 [Lentilactobacillus curieae]AQW20913.1 elongation factor 4 [Lentilactobacillus curieae]